MKRFAFALAFFLSSCAATKSITYQPCVIANDVCVGIHTLCDFLTENQDSLITSPERLDLTVSKVDSLTKYIHEEVHTIMDAVSTKTMALRKLQKGMRHD